MNETIIAWPEGNSKCRCNKSVNLLLLLLHSRIGSFFGLDTQVDCGVDGVFRITWYHVRSRSHNSELVPFWTFPSLLVIDKNVANQNGEYMGFYALIRYHFLFMTNLNSRFFDFSTAFSHRWGCFQNGDQRPRKRKDPLRLKLRKRR